MGCTGGKRDVPYTPSGVMIKFRILEPLSNAEPRYFIPASCSLDVISIERAQDYGSGLSGLAQWKAVLNSDMDAAALGEYLNEWRIDEIPWVNAANIFYAKPRIHEFPWGKAVLYMTGYVNAITGAAVNNDMLVLVVQGITHDGRYAVKGSFSIRHPKLPDETWNAKTKGLAVFDIDKESKEAEKWLNAQPDDSFQPKISDYIRLLEGLNIQTPRR